MINPIMEDVAYRLLQYLIPRMVTETIVVAILRQALTTDETYPLNYPLIKEIENITDEIQEQLRVGNLDRIRQNTSAFLNINVHDEEDAGAIMEKLIKEILHLSKERKP